VVKLLKYTTIYVPIEVKNRLQRVKVNRTWSDFLSEKCSEYQKLRGKEAFGQLSRLLSKDDLEAIRKSSKEFREKFPFR
jgi:hypothetical protein